MGGYGSGRPAAHTLVTDCLALDTTTLRRRKAFTGKLKQGIDLTFTVTEKDVTGRVTAEKHHSLSCIVQRYGDDEGKFTQVGASGHLTLLYGVKQGDSIEKVCQEVGLVTTRPNYGGQRWWFVAPCCGRRVRILYLPLSGQRIRPECRGCLNLHYVSQRQSYVERHKAYELHLLRNFGYWWAQDEYHRIKEHHLKLTPELVYMAKRSEFTRELEIMQRLIRCQRMMLRDPIRALRSLKSEDDRRVYIAHLVEQHGEGYVLDLIRIVKLGIEGAPVEEKAFEEQYMELAEKDDPQREPTVMTSEQFGFYLRYLIERKREAETELKQLVPVGA